LASSQNTIEQLLSLVHKEINRRETLDVDARKRKEQISKEYQPLYPELYKLQVENIRKNKILLKNLFF
jgi:hypothetical protein